MLSREASAEPGRWNTDRAPYQRGMLDALNDPSIETVVIMSSAQIGKTELLLNIIGYYMDFDPSPILLLQPTLQMAEAFSKDRLAPMLRDTPALKGKVKDARARDSGNTLLHKSFPGGHITMAGANSPASLASRPIRVFLADEVDRYPTSAGTEGDPVSLGEKRTVTFWNRKKIYVSTPTVKHASRIEMAYNESDKRKYHVPCPHCDEMQSLKWANVKWPKGEPEKACYYCEHCGCEIQEGQKQWMLMRGKWIAENEANGVAGFHLSELYSPWRRWADVAVDFVRMRKSPETLKTWVNTSLGETFEETVDGVDADSVTRLKIAYEHEIPADVEYLTMGADVQKDRIEAEIVGWDSEDRSWSIGYHILPGDTTTKDPWDQLTEIVAKQYTRHDGSRIALSAGVIDSSFNTQHVYDFCRKYAPTFIMPGKGMAGKGTPIVEDQLKRMRRLKTGIMQPQVIGTDNAKELVYSRLEIDQPLPGCCYFPDSYDDDHFSGLTAEAAKTVFQKGFPVRVWVKIRPRNEPLDCRVYALAAKLLMVRKAKPSPKPDNPTSTGQLKPVASRQRPRRSGYLSGYR